MDVPHWFQIWNQRCCSTTNDTKNELCPDLRDHVLIVNIAKIERKTASNTDGQVAQCTVVACSLHCLCSCCFLFFIFVSQHLSCVLLPLFSQHIFKYLQAEAVKKEQPGFLTGWKGFFKMVRLSARLVVVLCDAQWLLGRCCRDVGLLLLRSPLVTNASCVLCCRCRMWVVRTTTATAGLSCCRWVNSSRLGFFNPEPEQSKAR